MEPNCIEVFLDKLSVLLSATKTELNSCLAQALGVNKIKNIRGMILVTLCCAT
jgi:hypothetical protein